MIVRNCECALPGGLERALQSIRRRAPDAEICIVDTCSSDAGADVELRLRKGLDAKQVREILGGAGLEVVFVEPSKLAGRHVVRVRAERPIAPSVPRRLEDDAPLKALGWQVAELVGGTEPPRGWRSPAFTIGWGPGTIEIAQHYADIFEQYRGPRGDWDEAMPYFDDAAAARQHSFELASGTWRMWLDADDIWADPAEAERLLRLNGRWCVPDTGRPDLPGLPAVDAPAVSFEDFLRQLERDHPKVDCVWMPYLYRSTPEGKAMIWQERERCVKWGEGQTFRWAEAAHEVLVPVDPKHKGAMLHLEHALIVHEKRFTPEDEVYAIVRHWDVLLRRYTAGERTTRICRYLAGYADTFAPARKYEFILAGRDYAAAPLERFQALIELGRWYAARGLYTEAIESFGAANTIRSDLPDAWVAGALAATRAGDHVRAVDYLQRAILAKPSFIDSAIGPHDFEVGLRRLLVEAIWTLAAEQIRCGYHAPAEQNLKAAADIASQIYNLPMVRMVEDDAQEAYALQARARNAYESQKLACHLHELWDFLVRNDETQKAAGLSRLAPHTLQDHPLVVSMEQWARKIDRHLSDPAAYTAHYNDPAAVNDSKPTADFAPRWLDPETALIRARVLIQWLRTHAPKGEVLEVGPFDGVAGIPVLAACPEVRYVAVEAMDAAIEWFKTNARRFVPDGEARLTIMKGTDADLLDTIGDLRFEPGTGDDRRVLVRTFDAVVFFEVLEHVPNPAQSVQSLLRHVKPDGRLFLSTPWGAFDNGSPRSMDTRNPCGHVRAMTPRDFVWAVEAGGGEVETLWNVHGDHDWGNTLHAIVRRPSRAQHSHRPIAVCIPGSLWDWNATHVEATGIGASEETIVYLARELAKTDGRRVEVYGQVSEIEIKDRVAYWPREQVRHVPHDARVIVSRGPSMAPLIDAAVGEELPGKILWLQDAGYPDLNATTAAYYETIVVLSNWHREVMHGNHGVPYEKMTVIPNFLLREHFEVADPPKREPHHFVYASSPDRGLVEIDDVPGILDLWPEILKRWPDATLDIFYGWDGAAKLSWTSPEWTKRYRAVREKYERLRWQKGVRERGRVNHATIAREMMRASVWAYPTGFREAYCSNALKARAAGCVAVCPPLAALRESARCPETRYIEFGDSFAERFLEGIEQAIATPEDVRQAMARTAIGAECIEQRLPLWTKVLGL